MYKIVYQSNTGFTKTYAKILSKRVSAPLYEHKEAKDFISKDDKLIYMGWLFAGGIRGYEKFRKNHDICAVCAVGAAPPTDKIIKELTERHHIENTKVFYLQGGIDKKKLKGVNKLIINIIALVMESVLKRNKTENEKEMLNLLKNGGSKIDDKNLDSIVNWIND